MAHMRMHRRFHKLEFKPVQGVGHHDQGCNASKGDTYAAALAAACWVFLNS
jgi:hypothetical protein